MTKKKGSIIILIIILAEVLTIYITYRTKKLEKLCTNLKEAKRQIGDKAGRNLILRITQLKSFKNLQMVPSKLPWRREKLQNNNNRWAIRVDSSFRIEFSAIDLNDDLRLIEKIEIMEVSNHYE